MLYRFTTAAGDAEALEAGREPVLPPYAAGEIAYGHLNQPYAWSAPTYGATRLDDLATLAGVRSPLLPAPARDSAETRLPGASGSTRGRNAR